jgi:hypothetical protein
MERAKDLDTFRFHQVRDSVVPVEQSDRTFVSMNSILNGCQVQRR